MNDHAAWVRAVYVDVLGHEGDAEGVAFWTDQLAQGVPPLGVAKAFFGSEEWRGLFVRMLYVGWLRREPDPDGLVFHANSLASSSMDEVMTTILSSDEYFSTQCGSDKTSFVRNLYRDVLARSPADNEVAGWVGSGLSRSDIARGFLTSSEWRTNVLRSYYLTYLKREADAGGLAGWLSQVEGGMEWRDVASSFLTSQEYVALHGGGGTCSLPASEPQKKAVFTVGGGADKFDIEDEILRLLDAAVPFSEVRIAMYTFKRQEPADHIIAALDNDVDVRLVLDGEDDISPAVQSIIALYPNAVTICDAGNGGGGCLGNNINHNKFLTFTQLCDGSTNVSVQSSANWTKAQLSAHNNMVIVRNDPALHEAYRGYWKALKSQQLDPSDPFAPYSHHDGDTDTRAFFFPRNPGQPAAPATDTVSEILANVVCDPNSEEDFVYVTHALWSDSRSYLIDKLVAMRDAGCKIRIKVNEEVEVAAELNNRIPSTKLVPRIHSKYMLVHARFNGSSDVRSLVFTGSHNLNSTSLRSNDETILRVEDDGVFASFKANFEALQ